MTGQKKITEEARNFVSSLFRDKINDKFSFHNLAHTLNVLEACRKITASATPGSVSPEDEFALELAALFHDTGYSGNDMNNHEQTSISIAGQFLRDHDVPEEIIDKVTGCINATRMPQQPATFIEKVICDADLYHLGTDDFTAKTKLLRNELAEAFDQRISKKEWRKRNIEFLENHRYFTEFGRQKLDPVKQANLLQLKHKETAEPETATLAASEEEKQSKEEKKKASSERTERGITTMFRIMSNNHNNLSGMADNKANIMISVNSIIISIMVSVLLGRLAYYRNLTVPTIILLVTCVTAIIFSILATRPKISTGTFTTDDIRNKRINLLFFGNFYNMKLEEYNWAMNEMMNDRNYLYDSMLKDVYFLGKILAKKYKYLRLSYNTFMYGLIISMIAFAIAMFFPSDISSIP